MTFFPHIPESLAPLPATTRLDLLRHGHAIMARRTFPGIFAYPIAAALLVSATSSGWNSPTPVALAGAIFGTVLPRLWLFLRNRRQLAQSPRVNTFWPYLWLLLTVSLFAALCVHVILFEPFVGATSLAFLASIAMTSLSVIIFAPDLVLLRFYVLLLSGPVFFSLLQVPDPASRFIATAVLIYDLYLFFVGKIMHQNFWSALIKSRELRLRQKELLEAQKTGQRTNEKLEEIVANRTRELKNRERDYRTIFESAHDAILIFEPDLERILNANQRACEIYGFEHEELIGTSLLDLSKDPVRGARNLRETMSKGTFHNFETTQFRHDGSEMVLEINASAIEYQGRMAILSINRDITERRRTQVLQLAKEAAEEANAARGRFLATMSHEIRTPMGAIIGLTDLLLRSKIDGREREFLETIRSSADGLLRLIDDILDFSKIEAGKLSIESIEFDLHSQIEQLGKLFRPPAEEKGIQLQLEVGSEIPRAVCGDPTRLHQVLVNLVGNAIKFTDEGHVLLRAFRLGEPGLQIRFEVHDTGIGIRPEAQDQLFSAFSQAEDSTSREFGGTGLGLSICKRLVELMGGAIGLESVVGEGSCFWLELPLELIGEPIAPQPELATEKGERSSPESNALPILLAEDNAVNRLVALSQLKVLGYEADAVENGLEVLDALSRRSYAMVLMDCHMPVLDGYETTRRLRKLPLGHHLPIIAITANAMKGDRELCIQAGMDDYISKPFKEHELAEIMERWCSTPDPVRSPSRTQDSVL